MASEPPSSPEGSGVMLLRVWLHDGQVIARLQSFVAADDEQQGQVAVGTEQIAGAVRRWLEDLKETRR